MKTNALPLINMKNQNYTSKPPSIIEIKHDKEWGYIATETRLATDVDIENANLIAAAPDLLSALRFLLADYVAIEGETLTGSSVPADMARAAIAKAEGVA
jgi:hypothetical protein